MTVWTVLRWTGVLIALVAGGGIGLVLAERHRRRPRELAALRTAVQVLLSEIDVGLTPLPEALQRAAASATGPVRRLFIRARERLVSGAGITGGEAWARALDEVGPELAVDPDELDILRGLSACLGGTDRHDQRRHLLLAATRLDGAERRAMETWRQRHRVSVYLGFIGAAIIVLAAI